MNASKPWYYSKSIWGSLVAVAAGLAGSLGLSVDATSQGALADAAVQLIGALGALYAIYGRISANQVIA